MNHLSLPASNLRHIARTSGRFGLRRALRWKRRLGPGALVVTKATAVEPRRRSGIEGSRADIRTQHRNRWRRTRAEASPRVPLFGARDAICAGARESSRWCTQAGRSSSSVTVSRSGDPRAAHRARSSPPPTPIRRGHGPRERRCSGFQTANSLSYIKPQPGLATSSLSASFESRGR